MPNEAGEWIMRGLDWDDPLRIRTPEELIRYIDQVGFLPLFSNEIPGFPTEKTQERRRRVWLAHCGVHNAGEPVGL